MRIVLAGATGFIGRALTQALTARGDEVIALTRSAGGSARSLARLGKVELVEWKAEPGGPWERVVDGADAVVNLAGEPVVDKRWTEQQKKRIRDSRVNATRALVQAIEKAKVRPKVLVNASAIGFYGFREDETLDENAGPGSDFLASVCVDWEREAKAAEAFTRLVIVRIGVVLGERGGALEQMARPFKLGAGGPIGDGRQWVSWVALADVVGIVVHALDRQEIQGILNATAPEPVQNKDLAALIGKVLHRPNWMPVPRFALKIGLGDVADMLVRGQRVVPSRTLASGYRFRAENLEALLGELLR